MNSIIERWIQSCRPDLLDRALVWNHAHLIQALREYDDITTGTARIAALPTSDRCNRYPNRSPIPLR